MPFAGACVSQVISQLLPVTGMEMEYGIFKDTNKRSSPSQEGSVDEGNHPEGAEVHDAQSPMRSAYQIPRFANTK